MAIIGYNDTTGTTLTSKTLDTMTGDGSDVTLTLSQTPDSVNNVSVYLNGVMQRPTNEYTLAGNVITFTTAPATSVFVVAITGGGEHIGSPMAGSVDASKLSIGAVTDAKIGSLAGSKLTGTYPALNASAVTGLTATNLTGTLPALNASAVTGLTAANLTGTFPALDGSALTGFAGVGTESANDPTHTTNPSGGVGTIWINTTSGEVYNCSDATAGSNVWTNVGGGSGNIEPWSYQGVLSGFFQGGAGSARIDKWPFATQTNATDHGDLAAANGGHAASHGTATHGYVSGGQPTTNSVQKYSFASADTVVDAGFDLSGNRMMAAGSTSSTHGFVAAGGQAGEALVNIIDKFAFASSSDATDVGDVIQQRCRLAGQSSSTHGYCSGGSAAGGAAPMYTNIEKYSFASAGNSAAVGNITLGRAPDGGGVSSSTHGYVTGGYNGANSDPTIDKFLFSNESTVSDVGDLVENARHNGASSSTTHGFVAGGYTGGNTNSIQTFSFATDGNSTQWADLGVARNQGTGNQY